MARCLAFDKSTAQAISRNLHLLTLCDSEADPLQTALHSNSPATLLALPADSGQRVLLAEFRRGSSLLPPPPPDPEPAGLEASGFLGLGDQLVYAPEPQPEKKWWQKLLDFHE
jgi:hypothetical protein